MLRRTHEFSRLRENSKSHLVRLIDLGRWLKEGYRIEAGAEGEAAATPDETEIP